MTDPNVRDLFTERLALPWPHDPNNAPWQRLGLAQPPSDPQSIRQHAQSLLEKIQAARSDYPVETLQEAARQVKLDAREALSALAASPRTSDPASAGNNADPVARPAALPLAKPVAQPVSAPVAQPVAQPITPAGKPSPVVEIQVANPKRTRGGRRRSAGLGWAVALGLIGAATAGTAWWLNRDTSWLALAPTPQTESTPPQKRSPADNVGPAIVTPNTPPTPTTETPTTETPTTETPTTETPTTETPTTETPTTETPTTETPTTETPTTETPTTETPTTETPTTETPTTQTPTTQTQEAQPSPPSQADVAPLAGPPDSSTTTSTTDSGAADADPVLGTEPPEGNDSPDDSSSDDDARFLVVARQFELTRVFLAAGRLTEAQSAWEAGRRLAANHPRYQAADDVLQQLFAWRSEIYQTASQRLTLLNRVGEIPVDDTFVSVINATPEGLVVRAAGQRREFTPTDLPWNLVRGILEVTTGPDPETDRLRQVVTDCLRVHQAGEEQVAQWREALQTGTNRDSDQNPEYSADKLNLMIRFLDVNKRVSRLVVDTPLLIPLDPATWEPLAEAARRDLQSNRPRLAALRDPNRSRFEIEAELWQDLAQPDPHSIASLLWTLHWVAVERADLVCLIENLRTLQQIANLDPERTIWRDVARALGKQASGDPQLIEWLQLIQVQTASNSGLGPDTLTVVRQLGRQLATQLKDRTQRQGWVREFTAGTTDG